ncbi:hypothetical protein BC828DRAFT_184355 [Blastocladiella britannica]|nr:hypothetical protein BC828DRAFT_184355 [Blastocladiella britannica]
MLHLPGIPCVLARRQRVHDPEDGCAVQCRPDAVPEVGGRNCTTLSPLIVDPDDVQGAVHDEMPGDITRYSILQFRGPGTDDQDPPWLGLVQEILRDSENGVHVRLAHVIPKPDRQSNAHTTIHKFTKCRDCRPSRSAGNCMCIVPVGEVAIPQYERLQPPPAVPAVQPPPNAPVGAPPRLGRSRACRPVRSEAGLPDFEQKHLTVRADIAGGAAGTVLLEDPGITFTMIEAVISEVEPPEVMENPRLRLPMPPLPLNATLRERLRELIVNPECIRAYDVLNDATLLRWATPMNLADCDHVDLRPFDGEGTIVAFSDGSLKVSADLVRGQFGGAGVVFPHARDPIGLGMRAPQARTRAITLSCGRSCSR